jgi:hypothetical protein
MRGSVQETGDTKAKEHFEKLSRGRLDSGLVFGTHFFNLSP